MIKSKRLVEMTRKWQKVASMGRKGTSARTSRSVDTIADKGHFVVYSADKKRFVVPLEYLTSSIFRELFQMSEEEYGLPGDGPIVLPCDATFMEYVILFVRGYVSKDVENVLLDSIDTAQRSKSSLHQRPNCQVLQCF
ncbi:hypothetical protein AQUCO_04300104v1 [Aquilegia coerulea]|uniref:Uncharacterized protein n=1 Tax=Aquilegia coerulea TaxID=218851 RepID=A0A2G5CNU4_AQUCA|nr:hypothetical protein AQUCO_04300104v1 [Aquilegia coerulea]